MMYILQAPQLATYAKFDSAAGIIAKTSTVPSGCPKYITISFPQFNASITQLVIFNQPLKEILKMNW